MVVLISDDKAVGLQLLEGDADAWLGEAQIVYDVDGSDGAFFVFQYEYGLEIVFCRFQYFHDYLLIFTLSRLPEPASSYR